jgi:hypothetical protein
MTIEWSAIRHRHALRPLVQHVAALAIVAVPRVAARELPDAGAAASIVDLETSLGRWCRRHLALSRPRWRALNHRQ